MLSVLRSWIPGFSGVLSFLKRRPVSARRGIRYLLAVMENEHKLPVAILEITAWANKGIWHSKKMDKVGPFLRESAFVIYA